MPSMIGTVDQITEVCSEVELSRSNAGDEQVNVSPTEILLKQILEFLRMLDANRKMGRMCERMEVESISVRPTGQRLKKVFVFTSKQFF